MKLVKSVQVLTVCVCGLVVLGAASVASAEMIVAWGSNAYGGLDVPAGNDFVDIEAGYLHGLAIRSDGSLVGWGWN
ncbi:MAG: hypothetical protein GY778_30040, partial [bacterium]|nr:hypothetical protein [bacterium]